MHRLQVLHACKKEEGIVLVAEFADKKDGGAWKVEFIELDRVEVDRGWGDVVEYPVMTGIDNITFEALESK